MPFILRATTATSGDAGWVDESAIAVAKQQWTLYGGGLWAVDGDGTETNGGGIVLPPQDISLTNATADFCKVYDLGTTTYANLAASSSLTGWAANWQMTADAASEEIGDFVAFGGAIKFCEIGLDINTLATWGANGGVWKYWNGSAWTVIPAGTFYDNTDVTDATTGLRAFQQVGAFTFFPPTDWAESTLDGQLAYWITYEITAAQVTQTPITNSEEHSIAAPPIAFSAPQDGVITDITLWDGATTLHNTNDVMFFLHNFTTGNSSPLVNFTASSRLTRKSGVALAVSEGDVLWVVVVQEDSVDEVTNAVLGMEVTLS